MAVLALAFLTPAKGWAAETAAAPLVVREHCIAASDLAQSPMAAIASSGNWRCDGAGHSLVPERTIMRFSLDADRERLQYFISRRSPIGEIHVLAEDAGGELRGSSFVPAQMGVARAGTFLKIPLPEINADTQAIYAVMDEPTHVMTLQKAQLAQFDPGELPDGRTLMTLLAILCGMLLMPMVLNAAFFRILREPFVLWHTAMAVSLVLTILFNSGLVIQLFEVSGPQISYMSVLALGLAITSGAMFAHSFIEEDRLHPALRRALPWAAMWSLVVSYIHANFPFAGRVWQTDAYYLAYLPVLLLFGAVLVDALRRGSVSARFQAIGWAPLLLVGLVRQVSQFTPIMAPTDAMLLFYVGCVFEVVATTFGVTDRFMALKHQRDKARTEAQMLEHLSERDSLTGLYNRRVIEERFEHLRSTGFTVLALLDLDHFKHINDSFGHSTGDEVLRAVARALAPDSDTLVIRMGGEEFAILLRGRNALARAEHRRKAISRVVSGEVELDRLVTASMGVVDIPLEAMPKAHFETIYRHADRLLYEAKAAGRNRTMSEKMQGFGKRKARAAKAKAAA